MQTPTEVKDYVLSQVQRWPTRVPSMGGPTLWWIGAESCVYFTNPQGRLYLHLQEEHSKVKKIAWTLEECLLDECDGTEKKVVDFAEGSAIVIAFFERMNKCFE